MGLVLFLTGVNVGFMPVGNFLGQSIASLECSWVLIPIAMVIGYFIVRRSLPSTFSTVRWRRSPLAPSPPAP